MYTNVMYPESSYVSPYGSQAAKAHVMKNVKYVPVPKEGNEDTYQPMKKKMSQDTKFNLKFFGGLAALGAGIYGCIKHKGQIKEILANPKLAPVKEAIEKAETTATGLFTKAKTGIKNFFAKFSKKGAEETAEKAPGFFAKAKNAIKSFFSKEAVTAAPKAAKTVALLETTLAAEAAPVVSAAAPVVTSAAKEAGTSSVLQNLPKIPREILCGKNLQPFTAEIAAQEAGKAAGIILPPAAPAAETAASKGIKQVLSDTVSKMSEKLAGIFKSAQAEGAKKSGIGSIIKDTIGRHFFKK